VTTLLQEHCLRVPLRGRAARRLPGLAAELVALRVSQEVLNAGLAKPYNDPDFIAQFQVNGHMTP